MSMCITIEKMCKIPNVTQEKLDSMSSDGYDYIILEDCFGEIPEKVRKHIYNIPISYFDIDKIKRDNNISDDFELVGYGCLDDKFDFDFSKDDDIKTVTISDNLIENFLYEKITDIVIIKELVYVGSISYIGGGFKEGKNPFFDNYEIPNFIDTIDGAIKVINDVLKEPNSIIEEIEKNRTLLNEDDTIIFISS